MVNTRAAVRYAKAILSLAADQGRADVVVEDMRLILHTVSESRDLQLLLSSPIVKADVKLNVLREVFSNTSEITKGLFTILGENKRINILEAVAEKYIFQYHISKGESTAVVTTAIALTPELETKVLAKVTELTDKQITLENRVDPAIMGGFILRVGDKQYDASIASKFKKLEREFNNNLYVSQL